MNVLAWTSPFTVTSTVSSRGVLSVQIDASGVTVDGQSVSLGSANDSIYVFYTHPDTQVNTSVKISPVDVGSFNGVIFELPDTTFAAGTVKIAYSTDNGVTMSSNAFELPALPLAGGGGGGGGGNNGGNGYNNMATLELAYDGYSGVVSQTNTITVLGESRGALTADEIITVEVPLANFKKVLKYASTWDASLTGDQAGEQPRPRVKFTPTESGAALSELQAMLTGLKAKGTGAAASRLWADDANVDHQVFGGIMLGLTFDHSALDDDEVPRESIRKIVEGDLTVPEIDTTVTALDSQGASATLKGQLESLFEQAANAGRVKTSDEEDAPGFKNPSFEAGDSISFLVKYDFTKTRAYEVDDEVVDSATAGRATITVNGQTIQLAGYEETSVEDENSTRTYEIKLVATA